MSIRFYPENIVNKAMLMLYLPNTTSTLAKTSCDLAKTSWFLPKTKRAGGCKR